MDALREVHGVSNVVNDGPTSFADERDDICRACRNGVFDLILKINLMSD